MTKPLDIKSSRIGPGPQAGSLCALYLGPFRILSGVVLCLILAVFIASCSTRNTAFSTLANQGIVPVSADNPFVGSNVYLAREMEDSLYLYNFLKSRGAPRAVELTGDSERSADLILYYSAKQELYRASPHLDPMTKAKEWIIKGPYAIGRGLHREIAQLGPETVGVFEIFGRREVLGSATELMRERVIEPAFVPTPTPQPTPRPRIHRKKGSQSPRSEAPTQAGPAVSIQGTPMNLDQQAIAEAKTPTTEKMVPEATPVAKNYSIPSPPKPGATPAAKPELDAALGATVLRPLKGQ
jgi:hypothetical protein